jgi:FkbM family methyltransferase
MLRPQDETTRPKKMTSATNLDNEYKIEPSNAMEMFLQLLTSAPWPVNTIAYRKLKRRYATRTEEIFGYIVSTLTSDDIVLDLGANVGEYTELLAATGATVIAYEPDPYAHKRLAAIGQKYPNVTIHNKAVTRVAQVTRFESSVKIENGKTVQSAKASKIISGQRESFNSIKIKTESFSNIIKKYEYIKLIKCDIEGSELDILKNITENELSKIGHMFVETHERLYPSTFSDILKLNKYFNSLKISNINLYWR